MAAQPVGQRNSTSVGRGCNVTVPTTLTLVVLGGWRVLSWIGADVLYWPGHDRLEIAGLAAEGELPHVEIQVALGLSLGRFP